MFRPLSINKYKLTLKGTTSSIIKVSTARQCIHRVCCIQHSTHCLSPFGLHQKGNAHSFLWTQFCCVYGSNHRSLIQTPRQDQQGKFGVASPNCCAVQTVWHKILETNLQSISKTHHLTYHTQQTICSWPHLFCLLMSLSLSSITFWTFTGRRGNIVPNQSCLVNNMRHISPIGTHRPPPARSSISWVTTAGKTDTQTHMRIQKSLAAYISTISTTDLFIIKIWIKPVPEILWWLTISKETHTCGER